VTSLLSARKRADEFEALLNGHQTDRAELSELATVVTTLREHAAVAPRPDFAAALREQLIVEAATVLTSEAKTLALPTRRRGTRERRLVAAATAVVFVGGTAGMAAASQSALPGDTLYPIKRTIERAQAGLNTNDAGKGRDLLGQATDRLGEVQSLVEEKGAGSPQVPSTIDDFAEQAQEGADLLVKSFQENRDPKAIETVRSFAASSLAVLQELAKVAPPDAQEALANAGMQLQRIDQQALRLCGNCASDLPPLQITDVLLLSSDLRAAIEAAAKADNSRVQADKGSTSTGNGSTSSSTSTKSPAKSEAPALPSTSDPSTTVKTTTKDVKETVDNTVDPLEETLDSLIPGAGGVVGGLTDGVSEGLLGGN